MLYFIEKKILVRRRPALCTTRLGEPCAILVRMPCAAPCAEALCGALCGHVSKTAPFFGVQASSWLPSIFLRRRLNNCVALYFASYFFYRFMVVSEARHHAPIAKNYEFVLLYRFMVVSDARYHKIRNANIQ